MASPSRADVERMLLRRGGASRSSIPRLGPGEQAPLSFAQERMWLLDQMLPNVTAYNVPRLLRVFGRLDEGALRQALDILASRHTTIRTGIAVVDGAPVPQSHKSCNVEFEFHDLREVPNAAARADALVSELAWKRFDLERDAMVRAALVRLADHDRLLLVSHHLVSDEGSARILLSELAEAYAAAQSGRPPRLPDLPIEYADYAAWQRDHISDSTLDELTAYWRGRLAGAPERLDLPFDKPRPPVKTYRGAERRATLPAGLVEDLRGLSRSHNVSFFTVLLAGFYALLHRYTDAEDIVIGSPVSGRHHQETQGLLGFLSNTLVLRTDVRDELTFEELIQHVRATTLDALAHQELPFERLVEALNPRRDLSHTPIFQVLFAHDIAAQPLELGEFTAEPMTLPTWPWSRFDLSVGTQEQTDGSLSVVVEYSTDLFEAETVDRMIGHLAALLRTAADSPDSSVGTLSLLTDAEERILRDDWNNTDRPLPDCRADELVALQARERPEAVAAVCEGVEMTYAELDARANALARHLQGLGVGPEVLVAICVERSLDMLIGLLGIMRAGGAYVPVDPAFPRDRQQFMLKDAEVRVVVTQEQLLAQLPCEGLTSVCLDRDGPAIASAGSTPPSCQATADSLAYVMYTSGSTGRPKGVEIPHRALVNFLTTMRERPGLAADDVLVAVTTLSFDIAGLELYLPLITGAQVVIAPQQVAADPRRLAALIAESAATVVQATPTTWRMLIDAGWPGRAGLKALCGGEALPAVLAQQLLERGLELWNMYGPTETTIWSSVARVATGEPPTIGRPIANTRFYVVDRHLRLVPIGVAGELLIGGDGVARRYRDRADLTAERFVDDPFDAHRGRVYRTGDQMRFRIDGTLEFLGRLDHQVKVRGHRIELGEIETALDSHPDVRQAVALLHKDENDDKRLVAYVVAEPGRDPTQDALRHHMAAILPTYAVPSTIVRLDGFPHTPNGKVDLRALPHPEIARADLGSRYVAPSTPMEEALASIWRELLPIDQVGASDDFFAIGGHPCSRSRCLPA